MSSNEKLYLKIISRLIDTGYHGTSYGHPTAEEHFKSFVDKMRRYVPELRKLDPEDVEETVIDAINYASENWCRAESFFEHAPETGYYLGIGLFRCHHPELGRFYLVLREESNPDFNVHYFNFSLWKRIRDAEREYKELVKIEKEYLREHKILNL